MSIGSAGILYPVHPNIFHPDAWTHAQMRQWRPFEMTEFEWFHWWPFDLMIGLIALTLIVTTLRRIPLRVINLGVWTIHTGIIVLIVGSFIYFHAKVEGMHLSLVERLFSSWTESKHPSNCLRRQGQAHSSARARIE
jgi:hypothetical protein